MQVILVNPLAMYLSWYIEKMALVEFHFNFWMLTTIRKVFYDTNLAMEKLQRGKWVDLGHADIK